MVSVRVFATFSFLKKIKNNIKNNKSNLINLRFSGMCIEPKYKKTKTNNKPRGLTLYSKLV